MKKFILTLLLILAANAAFASDLVSTVYMGPNYKLAADPANISYMYCGMRSISSPEDSVLDTAQKCIKKRAGEFEIVRIERVVTDRGSNVVLLVTYLVGR